MDPKALFQITYGLYLLTAQEGGRDNGCIINTVMQVAEKPVRVAISVLKNNLTHDMVKNTGKFNVSAISTEADFELFRRFGMQSGRNVDKFSGFDAVRRSKNGLLRLTKCANMYLSAEVVEVVDLGTHSLFIAEVTEAEVLSDGISCSYSYYQAMIKPKPQPVGKTEKKKWVCEVCGWVYDEEETGIPWEDLPEDFVCPLCKHGKADFSPVG